MSDPKQILAAAKRILLVDWPGKSVPRTLIANGYSVFGASPGKYTEASVVADRPPESDDAYIFSKDETETGYLVFRRLDSPPTDIDIVNVFRPENELAGIIERIVLPSGAKVLWLHPPNTSAIAGELAKANGLDFVQGVNIAEVAANL
jgi:predicted CoA-binding protein